MTTAPGRSGPALPRLSGLRALPLPRPELSALLLLAAVQATCTPVTAVDGLYDCQGQAAALAAPEA
jgi:hypothetical protein